MKIYKIEITQTPTTLLVEFYMEFFKWFEQKPPNEKK